MAEIFVHLCRVTRVFTEGDVQRSILDNADLEITRGEFVAVLGRSGCGKSTLLNLVSGIDRPDAGEIAIAQQSLSGLSEHERTLLRRREMGFVFQFFHLIPTLTVAENVALPLELNGLDQQEMNRRVRDGLRRIELEEREASFPDVLSGGEQQRVALARALVHRPALLLADEPTGNLDSDTAEQVLFMIKRLSQEQGTTVIMATHSLEAARLADRVVTIVDGKVRPA